MIKWLREMMNAIIDRDLDFCPQCGYYCNCGNKEALLK